MIPTNLCARRQHPKSKTVTMWFLNFHWLTPAKQIRCSLAIGRQNGVYNWRQLRQSEVEESPVHKNRIIYQAIKREAQVAINQWPPQKLC